MDTGEVFHTGRGDALEQVAQGGYGCPMPGGIRAQAGCGSGQPVPVRHHALCEKLPPCPIAMHPGEEAFPLLFIRSDQALEGEKMFSLGENSGIGGDDLFFSGEAWYFVGVFFFFFVIFRGETLYSGGESRHFVERSGVLWEKMSSSLCGRESSVWRRR